MSSLDQSVEYRLEVQGHVDKATADWIGPVTITTISREDEPSTTTLSGIISDQAGIIGLIRRLHGLGIVLRSVQRMG